ncbi:hypothetical protein B0H16DRAFT_1491052 [Mycena metata]|uniref:Uncharacterized protein n=1 Tax=Mycena metata TaxID=1033252 RepID=A0AAD7KIU5_9AGAR|nr:hypothetical protein B0H16DRAFT_1491052 [Mycena metata]
MFVGNHSRSRSVLVDSVLDSVPSPAMSIWQIGKNELTDEAQAFKNKLSSKGQLSTRPYTKCVLCHWNHTHNLTFRQLNHESARAISLESTLAKCNEDLRNESLAAQNAAAALLGAQEKLKAKALETRELEATLETLSHKSDNFNARGARLEKEKGTLEARVRELEGNLRQLSSPAPTVATPSRQRATRRRSSSVSDTRIITLEQELKDTRVTLAQRETELRGATAKLAQTQNDLVKIENEKLASDKRLQAELREIRVALQDKSEELEYMREQQGDSGREDELLRRIDEDDATIAALKKLLADAPETAELKERLRRVEQKLLIESERVLDMEGRHIELIREKEEALDEVEEARNEISNLSDALHQKERMIEELGQNPRLSVEQDVERLLGAIDRIRGERDDARRTLEFQQIESKFAEEALHARIAALTANNANAPATVEAEVQLLQQQLTAVASHEQSVLHQKNQEIRRMGRTAMASAVVIEHLRSQAGLASEELFSASTTSENAMEDVCQKLKDVELQLGAAAQSLEAMTRQRDELLTQLVLKESEWKRELETVKEAQKDAAGAFKDTECLLNNVTAERDNLNLEVANFSADLEAARRELAAAETRYSALQFHQLASMSSNEATTTLRAQLAEQEKRVARRTEDLNVLQHDNQRLETNLRLQEERLSEMVMELEVLATEKDAMVDDCADARQARDAAIARVEELEVEMEGRLEAGDVTLCAMVSVVVQTVDKSREALRRLGERAMRSSQKAAAESISWSNRVSELDQEHQELQALVSSMEASHRAELERLTHQLAEKDRQLGENDLEGELAQLKVKHVEEMGLLQGQLVETTSALDEAQARCQAAEEDYRQALSESTQSKQELESAAGDAAKQVETLRVDLARIRDEHTVTVEALNTQITVAVSDTEKLQAAHRELASLAQARESASTRLKELEARVADLESQLEAQTEDAETWRRQLDEEAEVHTREQEELQAAFELATAQFKEELSAVSAELSEARSEVQSALEERTALQEEVTTLQAEIQRSLSLRRYLENQVKEGEQVAASLNADLEQVRAQHARAEKTGKAAEVNLSLQNAQHRREMSELQSQLAADLEERNNEMEELLKIKCAEIEENDDRALECRTCRRNSRHAKASNPSASAPMEVPEPEYKASPSLPNLPTRQRSNTLSAIPPGRASSNRVASGSALPRPKTPERKAIPVFKAQTPERRIAPIPPSPSAPVLGQKRRAPDDFEDIRVPTQGFTPESLPDENGTPRVRRVLTGFTPVRQSGRTAAVASPKRTLPASRSSTSYIADVTNSPRSGDTAKSKRSWLGKIRGTSRAAPGDL